MPSYYELDSSRVTLREYTYETKNPIVLFLALLFKLFRVRMPGSTDDANVDSTLECLVVNHPPEIEARFAPIAAELASLGFCDPVYHFFDDHGTRTRLYWATYRHTSGRHCARIHHRYWEKGQKKDRGLFPLFITGFTDGTFVVSSSGKPDVAAPPTVEMNRMPQASIQKLWPEHERRVTAALVHKEIQPVMSGSEVVEMSERLHLLQRDFHLARGFFRVPTDAERTKTAEFHAKVEEARVAGVEHPEVMAELTRLQEQKPKWSSAIWILVLSLIAFAGAGALNWDWKITLWLIPILLFHELGHWVAMRLFRYRNLRMFFIPFFGAAVTGQNWNVPGWKKALVSLAGPVPGIALGVVLGITAMVIDHQFLKQASLMLILINAFNLLPVLPLDGGHFLHAVLFCRNRWLDISFRALAVVALMLLGIFGMGKFLLGIGIILAIGLPVAFKAGKVTDRFRNQPLMPPLPGEDRIPTPTAQALIGAVKAELPGNAGNAVIAQQTLNIFETLNARPPNALATVGLLGLYGGTIFASVICATFLVISKEGAIGDFLGAAVRQPQLAVACDGFEKWRGNDVDQAKPVNLLVTSFDERIDAQSGFNDLKKGLPGDAAATLFGNSLLLSLPAENDAAREEWFERLQTRSTNTFVVVSNNAVTMSLNFIAPNATTATNIEQELDEYFQSPNSSGLIAPWHPQADSVEYKRFRQARRAWHTINEEVGGIWKDPSLDDYEKKILAAQKRGATREVQRLQEGQRQQMDKLRDEKRKELQVKYTETPFPALLELEAELSKINYTNYVQRGAVLSRVSKHLGELESVPASELNSFGSVSRHGLLMEAPWLTIHDPVDTLPMLLTWLCKHGCQSAKYNFMHFSFDANYLDLEGEE